MSFAVAHGTLRSRADVMVWPDASPRPKTKKRLVMIFETLFSAVRFPPRKKLLAAKYLTRDTEYVRLLESTS